MAVQDASKESAPLCVRCRENPSLPGGLCLTCERQDLAFLESHGAALKAVMQSVTDGERSEWPGRKHDTKAQVPGSLLAEATLAADQAWERPLDSQEGDGDAAK